MTSACLTTAIPLSRPWLFRLADQLRDRLAAVRRPVVSPGPAEFYVRDLEVLEQLSQHTLQDIGAPDWLLGRAAARRSAEQDRLQAWLGSASRHDAHRW